MEKVDDCTNPDNDFSLKQLIPSLGVGRTLAVDYNYPTLTFSQRITHLSSIPKYQNITDHKLNAFTLEYIFDYLPMNIVGKHREFLQVYKNETVQKETCYQPMPNMDICQICRTTFDDYRSHIYSGKHQVNLNTRKINSYILELCQLFHKRENMQQLKQTEKSEKGKCISQEIVQIEDKIIETTEEVRL